MIRFSLPAIILLAIPAQAAASGKLTFHTVKIAGMSVGLNSINDAGQLAGGAWHGALKRDTLRACFLYTIKTGQVMFLNDPSAQGGVTECWDITNGGTVVGDYVTKSGVRTGFVYAGGVFQDVVFPGAVQTSVQAMSSGSSQMAGYYVDTAGKQHGFVYDSTFFTEDVANATKSGVFGISASGTYVLQWLGHTGRLQSQTPDPSTPIVFPGSISNAAYHVDDEFVMVATTWIDPQHATHGGVYIGFNQSPYVDIAAPAAVLTEARGVNSAGQVAGRYQTKATKLSLGFYTTGDIRGSKVFRAASGDQSVTGSHPTENAREHSERTDFRSDKNARKDNDFVAPTLK